MPDVAPSSARPPGPRKPERPTNLLVRLGDAVARLGTLVFLVGVGALLLLLVGVFLRLGVGNMGRTSELFPLWGVFSLAATVAGALVVVGGVVIRWIGEEFL